MKSITFGMPTLIENRTLAENLSLCRQLGLQFLELNMNFPEYQLPQLGDTDRLRSEAEKAGVFYTVHLDENLDPAEFNPLIRAAWIETALRTIDIAKAIGAPILNMHMHHGVHITLPDRKVQLYDRDFDTYLQHILQFRSLCEDRVGGSDIVVSIENTDGFRSYEQAAIDVLLESPVFGLTWDIGHSHSAEETDLPFLLERESRLSHFHIHDATAHPSRSHLALGEGTVDLHRRLDCAAAHACRCVLETKTVDALIRSVGWLEQHI